MGEKKYTFVYWQYDGKQMGSFLIQKYDSVFIMDSRCPNSPAAWVLFVKT